MTYTVPRGRRRATSGPDAAATTGADPAAAGADPPWPPGRTPPTERLAALLAEAVPVADVPAADLPVPGAPADAAAGADPAHRWEVAPRTRVPASLLLLALAALAVLAWTVLGPGEGSGREAGAADEPVLAEVETTSAPAPTGASPAPGPPEATPSPGARLAVHVTGEVTRPGVVELEPGARVVDAVEAAGGLTEAAVTDTVNLAAPVADGQQVLVPDTAAAPDPAPQGRAAAPAPGAAGQGLPGAAAPAPGGALDLNTASAADLEALPRVGPVLAGRIVEFREQHGGFAAVADLDAVPGIGPALMESLTPLVTV